MTVFDNRVDHGVEIGRELEAESEADAYPDRCSGNVGTRSSPLPSEVIKDRCVSEPSVGDSEDCICSSAQKSVPLSHSVTEGGSVVDLRNSVYLSAPQVSGMRRTASFMKRLDSAATMTDLGNLHSKSATRTGQLYPSLADLNLVDDVNETQNHDSSIADLKVSEVSSMKSDFSFSHEDISKKVSRLCRVPTSAILYHLQSEDNSKKSTVEEMLLPKRVECERQWSSIRNAPAFKAKHIEVSENSKSPSSISYAEACENNTVTSISEDGEGRSGKGDVIFVIGENEQLVDLKQLHKSESENNEKVNKGSLGGDACDYPSVLSSSSLQYSPVMVHDGGGNSGECTPLPSHSSTRVSCLASDVESPACECECECDSTNKFKLNINLGLESCEFQEESVNNLAKERRTEQCTTCSTSKNGHRVITVRPSVIELEDECSELERDISVKNSVRTSKPVSRSLSLLSSLSGESVGKNASFVCRRHSDCVSEISRYLKNYHSVRFHFERCEGVLMNYIQGREQKKNVGQMDKKTVKVAEARGNFCLTESCVVCEEYSSVNKNAFSVGCSVNKTLVDKTSDSFTASVTRGEKHTDCITGDMSEGNAIFDDYSNLSDDDILCDIRTASKNAEDGGITSTGQHQCELLLELPLPRLV
jgi:hypothetical protein